MRWTATERKLKARWFVLPASTCCIPKALNVIPPTLPPRHTGSTVVGDRGLPMGQPHTLLFSRQTFCYSSRMALKMTEEEWSQFAATALVCRSCFWSAEVTRPQNKIWCAHRVSYGWVTDNPRCDGITFKYEEPSGDV